MVRVTELFSTIEDPRVERAKRHELVDILVIGLLTVLCGGETFEDMEDFGEAKKEWLTARLGLINGIPSHDTFNRVFARLDPEALRHCLTRFLEALKEGAKAYAKATSSKMPSVIAIDGKMIRHSFDTATGQNALHMVSAFAEESRLVLGQVKVDAKSNEITAIPMLLLLLDLGGCVVTIDAMGCQKGIARQIIEKGGDYLLALKGNQGLLNEDARLYLEEAQQNGFKGLDHSFHETTDYEHGRTETRRCWSVSDIAWLNDRHPGWTDLNSIVMVESVRTEGHKTSTENRFYISSLCANARDMLHVVRSHWSIENSLHWVLDVVFREDESRVRKDNAPENLALLRHLSLNIIRSDANSKASLKRRRKQAGWDNLYLEHLLAF
jgi:predicted transposase YbfD/YdcC